MQKQVPAMLVLTSGLFLMLSGCQRPPVVVEQPVLDRLRPEIDALARCVVQWERDCALMHMRNVLAVVKAGEGA